MTPKQQLIALWRKDRPERFKDDKPPVYTDKTANGLTKMILDWLKFSGYQGERINTMGRYVDNRKIITDTLGRQREIGSGKWIKGTGTKGSADISSIINGKACKFEVKIGRDKQSEAQKKYQESVEKSGGYYFIVKSFDEFHNIYCTLMNI